MTGEVIRSSAGWAAFQNRQWGIEVKSREGRSVNHEKQDKGDNAIIVFFSFARLCLLIWCPITYLEARRGQPTDRRKKRREFGMESKILGSARKGYFFRLQIPEDTPLYKPYRYVPHQRVEFLRRFGLKTGTDFVHFGLESGMVFEGTTGVYERTYCFNSKWVRKKKKYAISTHPQRPRGRWCGQEKV